MKLPLIAVVALPLLCSIAHAFEIEHVETKYQDKQYRLALTMVIDAPIAQVQTVLRDYEHYPQLDSRILEAKVMRREADNELLLYTKLHACFAVFCRNVKRVERVSERDGDLHATVLPEQSEVGSGETRTQLFAVTTTQTRITYTTGIAPGFWIPSFVGRPLMLRTLREASIELFRNVERRAQTEPR